MDDFLHRAELYRSKSAMRSIHAVPAQIYAHHKRTFKMPRYSRRGKATFRWTHARRPGNQATVRGRLCHPDEVSWVFEYPVLAGRRWASLSVSSSDYLAEKESHVEHAAYLLALS